jgi:hypothetical protein
VAELQEALSGLSFRSDPVAPFVAGDGLPLASIAGVTLTMANADGVILDLSSPTDAHHVSVPCEGEDLAEVEVVRDYVEPVVRSVAGPSIPANQLWYDYVETASTDELAVSLAVPPQGRVFLDEHGEFQSAESAVIVDFARPVSGFGFELNPVSRRRVCDGPVNVEMPDYPRIEMMLFNAAGQLLYRLNPSLDDTSLARNPVGNHFVGVSARCDRDADDAPADCFISRAIIYHEGFASEDVWTAFIDSVSFCFAMPSVSVEFLDGFSQQLVGGEDETATVVTATGLGPHDATNVSIMIQVEPRPDDVFTFFSAPPFIDDDPVVTEIAEADVTCASGDCAQFVWHLRGIGYTDTANLSIGFPVDECVPNATIFNVSSWVLHLQGDFINTHGLSQEDISSPFVLTGAGGFTPTGEEGCPVPADPAYQDPLEVPACSTPAFDPAVALVTIVTESTLLLTHEATPASLNAGQPDLEWGNANFTTLVANLGPSCAPGVELVYNLSGAPLADTDRAWKGDGFVGPFAPVYWRMDGSYDEAPNDEGSDLLPELFDDYVDFTGDHHPDSACFSMPTFCTSSSSVDGSTVSVDSSETSPTSDTDDDGPLIVVYETDLPTANEAGDPYFESCAVSFDWEVCQGLAGPWSVTLQALEPVSGNVSTEEVVTTVSSGTFVGADAHLRFILATDSCSAVDEGFRLKITNFAFVCDPWPAVVLGTYDEVSATFTQFPDDDDSLDAVANPVVTREDDGYRITVGPMPAGVAARVLHAYAVGQDAPAGTLTSEVTASLLGDDAGTPEVATASVEVNRLAELQLGWSLKPTGVTVVAGSPSIYSLAGDPFTETTDDDSSSLSSGDLGIESSTQKGSTSSSTTFAGDSSSSSTASLSTSNSNGPRVGNLVKTLTIANDGPSSAVNVVVDLSFVLPTGVSIVAAVPATGMLDDSSNPTLWEFPYLGAWESTTLEILVQVDACADTEADFTCTASATATTPLVVSPVVAVGEVDVIAQVTLVVASAGSPNPAVVACESPTTVLSVALTNEGPSCVAAGTDLTVQLAYPDLGVVVADPPTVNGAATWSGFGAPAGNGSASGTLELTANLPPAGSVSVAFAVDADETAVGDHEAILLEGWVSDVEPASAEVSTARNLTLEYDVATVGLIGLPNLLITKVDTVDPVIAGEPLSHIVTVRHAETDPAGPVLPAKNVLVSDRFGFVDPTGISFAGVSTSVGSASTHSLTTEGGAITWAVGDLYPGDEVTMTVDFDVTSAANPGRDCVQDKVTLTADPALPCLPTALRATDDDWALERTSVERLVKLDLQHSVGLRSIDAGVIAAEEGYNKNAQSEVTEVALHLVVGNVGPSDAAALVFNVSYDMPKSAVVQSTEVSAGLLPQLAPSASKFQQWVVPLTAGEYAEFRTVVRVYQRGQAALLEDSDRVEIVVVADTGASPEETIVSATEGEPLGVTVLRWV